MQRASAAAHSRTELNDEMGERLRKVGNEFGASTGRPRRCGWIDLVALKRAVQINGINGLAITKLDVLDGLPSIKVCIAYEYRGKRRELAPLDADGWAECKPVYLEFPRLGRIHLRHPRLEQAAPGSTRVFARGGRTLWLPPGHRGYRRGS